MKYIKKINTTEDTITISCEEYNELIEIAEEFEHIGFDVNTYKYNNKDTVRAAVLTLIYDYHYVKAEQARLDVEKELKSYRAVKRRKKTK
ncbi:MAG: hypothetical protein ACO3GP_01250 [Candidatus Limnocylindrus sp.]